MERLLATLDGKTYVARLGGDEFAVLIPQTADRTRAVALGNRIIAIVEQPIERSDRAIRISASVGISFFDEPDGTVEQVVIDADLALYAAKAEGKGRTRLFTSDLEMRP